jgi:hypothetical protein
MTAVESVQNSAESSTLFWSLGWSECSSVEGYAKLVALDWVGRYS